MSRNSRQYQALRFQNLARREYFEGWYYKQVSFDEKTIICFIPGVSVYRGTRRPFIQAILAQRAGDAWQQTTDWLDVQGIQSHDEPFHLQLGESSFRRDGLTIAYRGEELQAEGDLRFHDPLPLPASRWAPTIMGPFAYLPGMACIHSVISLTHTLSGSLLIKGELVDFAGGKGYIEKDWGSSFPERYVWLQCNHFTQEGSLFFSWADIPALGASFSGYIAHLYYAGEHHRFATYTRGRCSLKSEGRGVEILLTKGDSRLRITASQSGAAELVAPHRGQMVHTIKEGLFGQLSFHLDLQGGRRILGDQSSLAGIELVWSKGEKRG
ncbi:MAG: tocopherol cyclase family protein [Christensenellales bacterium]